MLRDCPCQRPAPAPPEAPAPPSEQHAGPDALADEALAEACGELHPTDAGRAILGRVLRKLARRVALETMARVVAAARGEG